jgi:hypothetical protein
VNRVHTAPPEINERELRERAKRRRTALAANGCSTYTLGARQGQAAIICLCCGLGSANPSDISERYCGFCREFHSEDSLA